MLKKKLNTKEASLWQRKKESLDYHLARNVRLELPA